MRVSLAVITRRRIKKAEPTSNLIALNCEDVDPFCFKQLLSIHSRYFFPAQHCEIRSDQLNATFRAFAQQRRHAWGTRLLSRCLRCPRAKSGNRKDREFRPG
jgi:hypothetical protein